MLIIAFGSLVVSAGMAYLTGYAFTLPREAFLRSRIGILLLIGGVLTFVALPPQLLALGDYYEPLAGGLGGAAALLVWPASLGKGLYLGLWIVTSVVAFLLGMRIWQLGTSEWRGGGNRAFDASAASRVNSMLPVANHIEEALDTIARSGLSARDLPKVAEDIRSAGRRFAGGLPPSDGEVYRLVSAKVPAGIAGEVTGYLLEGAGRRGARA